MLDNLNVTGHIHWEHYRDGVKIAEHETHNLVTTNGKTKLANLLNSANAGNTFATYMGFGTGTTAEAAGDSALQTELTTTNYSGYTRPSVTVSNPANGQVQYVATLTGGTPSGGSVTVTEAGLFDAGGTTGGTLVAHRAGAVSGQTGFGSVALQSSSDSLKVTWTITIG